MKLGVLQFLGSAHACAQLLWSTAPAQQSSSRADTFSPSFQSNRASQFLTSVAFRVSLERCCPCQRYCSRCGAG